MGKVFFINDIINESSNKIENSKQISDLNLSNYSYGLNKFFVSNDEQNMR